MRGWLESTFPELQGRVTGGNSPVPPIIELLMKIMNIFQFLGIILVVMQDGFFRLIGMQRPPAWYNEIFVKNAMPIMIFVYLVLPQILNGYLVSGAFEVILDGNDVVFSKLATRRMPNAEDLIAPLTKAGLTYISR